MILSWMLQGVILAIFVVAGLFIGVRLAGLRSGAAPAHPTVTPEAATITPAPAPPVAPVVPPAPEAAPVMPAPVAVPPAPAPQNRTAKPDRETAPELEDMRHAFEFSDDDRLTIILEMPVEVLDNDRALVDIWVEAVGWARLEHVGQSSVVQMHKPTANTPAKALDTSEAEQLQVQLDEVLQRLQLSAERRREMRELLDNNMPRSEII